MSKFRSVPVEVDAIQWTGDNLSEIFTIVGRVKQDMQFGQIGIFIPQGGGYQTCEKGDWVVRFPEGHAGRVKAAEFAAGYEPSPSTAPSNEIQPVQDLHEFPHGETR